MTKRILLSIILISIFSVAFSEENPAEFPGGSVKGFVFDESSNIPLEYATISMKKKEDNQIVNGTITDQTGFFKLKGIDSGEYEVSIIFIGYNIKTISKVLVIPNDNQLNLG